MAAARCWELILLLLLLPPLPLRPLLVALAEDSSKPVQIFHVIDNSLWGEVDGSALQGKFECRDVSGLCEVISTDAHLKGKDDIMGNVRAKFQRYALPEAITVGLYNIHTWGPKSSWPHYPDVCALPTLLTIAESEESTVRFRKLFSASFSGFDGNSTTHPTATVQRSYIGTGIFNSSFFIPLRPFAKMIPGAAYVASTCHRGRSAPKREEVVTALQPLYRVDSLGKCHKSTPAKPDAVKLKMGRNALETLRLKQEAISQYLFYLAFENNIEAGYVTEKVFDALIAGTVPVYLGATDDCRKMLPHPKAAIFLDDFGTGDDSVIKLSTYLNMLTLNSTAYEEHRAWRRIFDPATQISPLIATPWPCRICDWARKKESEARGKPVSSMGGTPVRACVRPTAHGPESNPVGARHSPR